MATESARSSWKLDIREAFLSQVRLFQRLSPPVLRDVAANLRPRRFERGEYVFFQGEAADTLNLLAAGRIKVVHESEDGREVILRLINPGEIFGGAGGWGEAVYPASAVAQENSVALQLPARAFADLVERHPDFAMAVIQELGTRLREAEARIRDLQTERVERRIARVIMRLANKTGVKTSRGIELGVPLSRQDLAELSGTTLSTASRTLSGWDQKGIVSAGREKVTIVQPHVLVSIAEDFPGRDERENA